MNIAPTFHESLLGIQTSKINSDIWQSILETFDAKQYKETFLGVLNYIDGSIVKTKGNEDLSEFILPHGSTTIYISLKNGVCSIKAPFLQLPEKSAVGLLRQIAEINFSVLVMSQIVLRENKLYFEFECPMELLEPYKIYSVLEEICLNGDYYDDMFVEKFGATHLENKKINPFSAENIENAWNRYQEYLKEAFDYLNYFESKRLYGFAWDAVSINLMKIDYYMIPQGFLRSELEKCIVDMNNNQIPLNEVLEKAKIAMKKLLEFDRKKFEESIYIPECLISAKKRCDLACTQNMLKKDFERAKTEMGATNYIGATLCMLYGIYYLYYGNYVPVFITEAFNDALKKASGKIWKEAAEILWKEFSNIIEMKGEKNPTI